MDTVKPLDYRQELQTNVIGYELQIIDRIDNLRAMVALEAAVLLFVVILIMWRNYNDN